METPNLIMFGHRNNTEPVRIIVTTDDGYNAILIDKDGPETARFRYRETAVFWLYGKMGLYDALYLEEVWQEQEDDARDNHA